MSEAGKVMLEHFGTVVPEATIALFLLVLVWGLVLMVWWLSDKRGVEDAWRRWKREQVSKRDKKRAGKD